MALNLTNLRELAEGSQGDDVQAVAHVEHGKIVVLASKKRITIANLFQSPRTEDQMPVVMRGWCQPLIDGGPVIVFGRLVKGSERALILATQVRRAGTDGGTMPMLHDGPIDCALCEFHVEHAH